MAEEYEGDYRFGEAGAFDQEFRTLVDVIIDPAANQIAGAFQRSIERVVQLNVFPITVINGAQLHALAMCIARQRLGLPIGRANNEDNPVLAMEWFKALFELYQDDTRMSADMEWKYGNAFLRQMLALAAPMKSHSKIEVQEFFGGVESILYAMLSSSYGAFETAATDLWVELLNQDMAAAKNWADKNEAKSIKWTDLAAQQFDLVGKVGAYLQRNRIVSFGSLKDIKSAYHIAFKGAADQCFEPWGELYQAEKIRHLLAHRAGIIDAKFLREMEGTPEYGGMSVGEYLKVDGPMVRKNAYPSVRTGIALLKFADARLQQLSAPSGAP